jgi:hypothetical protein
MCRKIITLLAGLLAISQISLAQIHPLVACSITGTSPVNLGNTETYTLSGSCTAASWTATCGTVQSHTSTSVTVYFNVQGCTSSLISARSSSGSTLASKTVTVNQPPALVCGSNVIIRPVVFEGKQRRLPLRGVM